jgi:Rrf2 family protein
MKFPTTVRYGTRAMTQLAAAYPDRAVSVRELGEQEDISPKYLEHILQALKAGGLVQVVRGRQGGYVLARPPRSITVKDVYERLAGSLAPVDCVDRPESCPKQETCPTWDVWAEVKEAVATVLERTTIQDLWDRKQRKVMSSAARNRRRVSAKRPKA